jgi:hypothetical protein
VRGCIILKVPYYYYRHYWFYFCKKTQFISAVTVCINDLAYDIKVLHRRHVFNCRPINSSCTMCTYIPVISVQNFKPLAKMALSGGADKCLARPGKKQVQRPNSEFIQDTPHEAQYTS